MIEVTKMLPITVQFEGCFCSSWCQFKQNSDCKLPFQGKWGCASMIDMGRVQALYYVVPRKIKMPKRLKYANVRTRECCETFGMEAEND